MNATLYIISYDEQNDTFAANLTDDLAVTKHDAIPAALIPYLVGGFDEPSELVGRAYPLTSRVS